MSGLSGHATLTATVVVAVTTVVYATLTFYLLRATQRSADGAAKAAESAALAIRITNANIVVNFDAEYVWQPPLMFLTMTPRGANTDILSVVAHFGKTGSHGESLVANEELFPSSEGHPVAGDSRMQYQWESPSVQPEQGDTRHTACVLITYRLTEGAPERTAWIGADMYLPPGWTPVSMPPGQSSNVIQP